MRCPIIASSWPFFAATAKLARGFMIISSLVTVLISTLVLIWGLIRVSLMPSLLRVWAMRFLNTLELLILCVSIKPPLTCFELICK